MSGNPSPSPQASPDLDDTKTVIGIAFGNTTSSIAYTTPDGKAEVIANEEGDRQIPSVLSWVGSEEYHGTQAKSHLVRNAKNTVAYFRDFLGKHYSEIDPTNSHNSAHPVDVDDVPSFNLQQADNETISTVSINEITTRHLIRLKESASDFLGHKVTGAVITVPTDFSDAQKKALVTAAKAAELEVLQIIHEPVAAVLAYAARQTPEEQSIDKNILVADLGGTRCDAAVVASRGGMYTILATAHDYELGGLKLDEVLVDHFSKEFIKKHKADPRENERSLAKLKLETEGTKRTLSLGTSATISIESLADGYDFHSTVNRLRYELSAKKVFDQIVSLAENVVKKAELDLLDIGEVILSGGTSHTPKIASRIAALFPESVPVNAPATLATALNPSELSARGAAIQASLIAEFDKEDIEQSTHPAVTVAPHLSYPIGVVIGEDNSFQTILEAQTAVPARRIAQFDVKADGDVIVRICEGIREIVVEKVERQVNVIAEAAIKGAKKGGKVEVTINVGSDLGLNIAARVVGTQIGARGEVKPEARSA
ncbi:actin-like ATPase domain-containing protein [Choiromyces venosus 120613-1]|uniref:Actin-like ATPase domain-containing protein n=1 Tax=Choiromyces venosus 120613-1 TaxID=1336337 RepID=A0A3N4JSY6_9PEZI|nr:actin-like ATPase domain-containing protein [Choiromyces venosus 120613-1]